MGDDEDSVRVPRSGTEPKAEGEDEDGSHEESEVEETSSGQPGTNGKDSSEAEEDVATTFIPRDGLGVDDSEDTDDEVNRTLDSESPESQFKPESHPPSDQNSPRDRDNSEGEKTNGGHRSVVEETNPPTDPPAQPNGNESNGQEQRSTKRKSEPKRPPTPGNGTETESNEVQEDEPPSPTPDDDLGSPSPNGVETGVEGGTVDESSDDDGSGQDSSTIATRQEPQRDFPDEETLKWAERGTADTIQDSRLGESATHREDESEDDDGPQFDHEALSNSLDVSPDELDWEREIEQVYEPPESQQETLRRIDDFLDEIEEDLPTARERVRASEHYKLYDSIQRDKRAQDKLAFDYVRDDGIAVDGEDYIGLIYVTPRDWHMLSKEQKYKVSMRYLSFLKSLKHAVAIPAYPREFDLTRHLELVYETGVRQATDERNPLFDYGRRHYQVWLDSVLDTENIIKRDYYIVFRVKKPHVAGGITNNPLISRVPIVGTVYDTAVQTLTSRKSDDEVQEEVCIKEVRKRRKRLIRIVNDTGVNPEPITDRDEAMEILYHYYNHVEPKIQEFNHATGIFDVTEV